MERGPTPPAPRPVTPSPDVELSASLDVIPVAVVIRGGEISLAWNVKIPSAVGTFGVHISPRRVRWLYLTLGTETRTYQVDGRIKLFIPNSLSGKAVFEWDDDICHITIPDPENLRFPEPAR